jgi:hypothetical protein
MLADARLRVLTTARPGPETSYAYWLIPAKAKPRADVVTTSRWIKSEAEAEADAS